MRTIPDVVLDRIVEHRPHLGVMVTNLRNYPDQAPQLEQAIAVAYLIGETRLSAQDTWYLSQVAHGGPWGGDWVRSTHAAVMLGVDESRIRHRIAAGELPSLLYGKTRYVRRDKMNRKERAMKAVEIKLETGTYYIPLSTFDHGKVLVPADNGAHVLSAADIRANWDAWVAHEVDEGQLLTRDELDARYPGIEIDHE